MPAVLLLGPLAPPLWLPPLSHSLHVFSFVFFSCLLIDAVMQFFSLTLTLVSLASGGGKVADCKQSKWHLAIDRAIHEILILLVCLLAS
ncbi:hypothetical protein V8C35DRAFT_305671 [Trichoderma chlorosporum]